MKRKSSRPAPPTDDQLKQFYQSLPTGRANAITARRLGASLGFSGRNADRILRNLAQHSTEAGMLVCADNNGYFRPANAAEAEETIARLESQSALMSKRARQLKHLVNQQFYNFQERML